MLTISAIKADVGSVGGHTRPAEKMLEVAREGLESAAGKGLLTDFRVTYTGDDICLLMIHHRPTGDAEIHQLAWDIFKKATRVAKDQGLYGAGQDLLVDAPSGNIRGAGPGVAEISFDPEAKERPAEPFLVFTADKCGPGAFNFPLWAVFTSPLFCAGLMLPQMKAGFRFMVIDMEHGGEDRIIEFDTPENHIDLAILLRDENRFGVDAIHSRRHPKQQVVSVAAHRLHTVAGKYTGKDDPVAIVRTQGIFPATEEVVSPFLVAPYVAGDARGSHHMPLMPVPIGTSVAGPYCLPIVSCMAYSLNKEGKLSDGEDLFANLVWDATRQKAQQKAEWIRQQGFFGAAMLPIQELEYGAFRDSLAELEKQFKIR